MNFKLKSKKTPPPAKTQIILGRLCNSSTGRITTAEQKRQKYLRRLREMSSEHTTTKKMLEKLHGNLNYVAGIEPYGRPFLAHLTNAISGSRYDEEVILPFVARRALLVWERILTLNKGSSMEFIIERLPRSRSDIFVDASSSWGIGGCCGKYFFAISLASLKAMQVHVDIIARLELLAALVSILCFGDLMRRKLVYLHIDNDNAYNWLRKSRSSNLQGTRYLALWELMKYKLECKVSPFWIPSDANRTADTLSRGTIPSWLKRRGIRRRLSRTDARLLRKCPIKTWLENVI